MDGHAMPPVEHTGLPPSLRRLLGSPPGPAAVLTELVTETRRVLLCGSPDCAKLKAIWDVLDRLVPPGPDEDLFRAWYGPVYRGPSAARVLSVVTRRERQPGGSPDRPEERSCDVTPSSWLRRPG
jgi:hypothetical protein